MQGMKYSANKTKNYRTEYSKNLLQNIKELLFYNVSNVFRGIRNLIWFGGVFLIQRGSVVHSATRIHRDFQFLTNDKPKIVEDTNAIDGPEGKLK